MKSIVFKHLAFGIMALLFSARCFAVADPAVLGATISPAPVTYPGGTATFQFQVNNNGTATNSPTVTVTISFSKLDFLDGFNPADDILQTAGNTPFTWSYETSTRVLTATLAGNFTQFAFNTFQVINLDVTDSAPISNPNIGGNVNVIAPPAVNSNTSNDNTFSNTYSQAALPVELLSFEARRTETCEVKLMWESAEESKFDYYQAEASTDGENFRDAGTSQDAKGSNSRYEQMDRLVDSQSGYTYYRLKMVDLDGSFEYSEIVSVHNDCTGRERVAILPNPSSGQVWVDVSGFEGDVLIQVYDSVGKLCLSLPTVFEGRQALDLTHLAEGSYFVEVVSGLNVFSSKLVKQ